jgi:hypothetical protein
MSQGDGTGEGLVRAYFSRVGWPTFLPTKEEDIFTRKVHELKQVQLKKLIQKRKVPPREDVDKVGVGVLAKGFRVLPVDVHCRILELSASTMLHACLPWTEGLNLSLRVQHDLPISLQRVYLS